MTAWRKHVHNPSSRPASASSGARPAAGGRRSSTRCAKPAQWACGRCGRPCARATPARPARSAWAGSSAAWSTSTGRFPEVCKKSVQAMAADMQARSRRRFFEDFGLEQLARFSPRELEAAGRLTQPMYAGPLRPHYRPIAWDDALDRIADETEETDRTEAFFYFSGRSSNEAGFLLQLLRPAVRHQQRQQLLVLLPPGVGRRAASSVTGSGTGDDRARGSRPVRTCIC